MSEHDMDFVADAFPSELDTFSRSLDQRGSIRRSTLACLVTCNAMNCT